MPRALKSDKFLIYAPKKSGYWKGKMLIGVNLSHAGEGNELTVQDLLNFLNEKGVDPSAVKIPVTFTTYARA